MSGSWMPSSAATTANTPSGCSALLLSASPSRAGDCRIRPSRRRWPAASAGPCCFLLFFFTAAVLAVEREGGGALQRARMVVAFLAQAWRHAPSVTAREGDSLPAWMSSLWEALHHTAGAAGADTAQPPPPLALDYASYVLHNWQPAETTATGAFEHVPAFLFTGGEEERMLLGSLLAAEAAGGEALVAAVKVQQAAREWDSESVAENLHVLRTTLCELAQRLNTQLAAKKKSRK
eukprot:COSAG06_NODE_9649_length_1851_cov_468.516553_1_plen_234_part_10